MSVRKWMFAGALLLAAGLSSLGFAQKPGLKFNPDKKFMLNGIIQCSYGFGPERSIEVQS